MQETQDKPNVSRRDCLPGFGGGRLAALPARTKAGNVGTTSPGLAVSPGVTVRNKAKLGGTGVCG
jgi:hypothetical protein